MRHGRSARQLAILVSIATLGLQPGCSGGDGGVIAATFTASFMPTATTAAPDLVRLRSVATGGDMLTLEVSLGGPSTSTDLYTFAFDLVLSDPTIVAYVEGTETLGHALTASGGQTVDVEAAQVGDRVIVGVTKLGGGAGNGVTGTESDVVRLTFRVLKAGASTLAFHGTPSPSNPAGLPAALDSQGNLVGSLQFDAAVATIVGS